MSVTPTVLENPLAQLPVLLTSLIGRERELATARTLLRDPSVRLVSLTGPGGVGKTRLASEIARCLATEFPEGSHFVPLAGVTDAASVAASIAWALAVREAPGQPVTEALLADLPHREALVVLDNFEQVDAAAPLVAALLAAGCGLKLLVTSRSLLRLTGEHHLPVLPLAGPDPTRMPPLDELMEMAAVRLFAERAMAATGDFVVTAANATDVAHACARLDCLPLALELAAARLRHMPLPALVARLERRLTLLVGGPRDSPVRLQTLRAAIDWSYAQLDPVQQTLFRRLSVFVGGWTIDAAEAVAGDIEQSGCDMLEHVSALVDVSLVTRSSSQDGEPRFAMLETIREFGREQLAESGDRGEIERQHSAFFLDLAAQAHEGIDGPEQRRWLTRLASEYDNIRAVLDRATEEADAETALKLGVSLWGFWVQRGHIAEGRQILKRALQIGGEFDPAVRVRAVYCLGILALDLFDATEAETHLRESLVIWRQVGNQDGVAAALTGLGLASLCLGHHAQARRQFEESLAIWSVLDDQSGIALSHYNNGRVATAEDDYERARALHESALTIRRQLGDANGIAYSLWALATVDCLMGRTVSAEDRYRESLAIFSEIGDRQGQVHILHGLADVAQQAGKDLEALRMYADALSLAQALGERSWMVGCIEGIAAVVARRGHVDRAVRLLGAAAPLRGTVATVSTPAERRGLEETLAIARRTLTNSAYAEAWAAGQALSLEQAMAEALESTAEDAATRSHPAAPFNLTRREQEVLMLLCQHLTDPEIAKRLFITTKTASNHVASIISKLGVTNRREVIAFSSRHGLVR